VTEPPVTIPSTGQVSLLNQAAELNAKATWIGEDASILHRDVLIATLNDRTKEQVKRSVRDMLTDLGDDGFSWRDIARVIGVTVPAVQKWRRGERASPDRVVRLGTMCALVDILGQHGIQEVASWFELRLQPEVAVTCLDLAAAGRYDLVLKWGTSRHGVPADSIFDEFDADWRSTRVDDLFEVFPADDGVMSIRPRSRP
jgi:transcriptional regulator with XRE-family HTH domain